MSVPKQPRHIALNFLFRFVKHPDKRRKLHDRVLRAFDIIAKRRLRFKHQVTPAIRQQFVASMEEPDFTQRLERLKQGLDKQSTVLIDLYLQRQRSESYYFYKEELADYCAVSRQSTPFSFSSYDTVCRDIFVYECGLKFLPNTVLQSISQGYVIDGGTASGDSALVFAQYGPKGVYAFEPSEEQAAIARQSIGMNKPGSIIHIIEKGLGAQNDTVTGYDLYGRPMSLEAVRLDDFAADKKISLIKLDVEGAETDTLLGARQVIMRDRPILLICLYHNPGDFFGIKPYLEDLGVGYNFLVRSTEACSTNIGLHLMLIAYTE